eukprot:2344728-Prymnesium_polylepis.1
MGTPCLPACLRKNEFRISEFPAHARYNPAEPPQRQWLLQQQQQQQAEHAAAPAAADPAEVRMEIAGRDEQPAGAEPRVAAAAMPHKRQTVAAGTAVGEAVGVADGKLPAGSEG